MKVGTEVILLILLKVIYLLNQALHFLPIMAVILLELGFQQPDFASVRVTGTSASSIYYGTAYSNTLGYSVQLKQLQFSADNTAPTINANNAISIPNTPGTANRTLSTVVADQAGTPVSGIPTEWQCAAYLF